MELDQEVKITKKTLRDILIISLAFSWIGILKYIFAPEKYCFWESFGGFCGVCLMVYCVVYAYKWFKIRRSNKSSVRDSRRIK